VPAARLALDVPDPMRVSSRFECVPAGRRVGWGPKLLGATRLVLCPLPTRLALGSWAVKAQAEG